MYDHLLNLLTDTSKMFDHTKRSKRTSKIKGLAIYLRESPK